MIMDQDEHGFPVATTVNRSWMSIDDTSAIDPLNPWWDKPLTFEPPAVGPMVPVGLRGRSITLQEPETQTRTSLPSVQYRQIRPGWQEHTTGSGAQARNYYSRTLNMPP